MMRGISVLILLYSSFSLAHDAGATIRKRPTAAQHPQCAKSKRLTVSVTGLGDNEEQESWTVAPGAPVKLQIRGLTNADILAEDDVALYVWSSVKDDHGHRGTKNVMKFSFCSQWTGVQCPVPAGTAFDATIMWNAPLFEETVSLYSFAFLSEPDASSCFIIKYNVVPKEVRYGSDVVGAMEQGPVINPELVDRINAREGRTWTAEVSPRFHRYSVSDARRIAGGTVLQGQDHIPPLRQRTYVTSNILPRSVPVEERRGLEVIQEDLAAMDGESVVDMGANKILPGNRVMDDFSEALNMFGFIKQHASCGRPEYVDVSMDYAIPDSFDAREAFPECASVIGRVRDQSDCGSCWAFASTEAFNDRRCVAGIGGEGLPNQLSVLSAEDTTACCRGFRCFFSMGCNGGHPGAAWRWFRSTGVVTGGDYPDIGKGTTCKPYEFMPCAHHVDPSASGYPECPEGEYPTPQCLSTCSEHDFETSYSSDKQKASEYYSLTGVADIQRDLMRYGSVTAAFTVYSDFPAYSGGVYHYVEGEFLGGHAVKIIGWGTDESTGEDYWLVVNSWNDSWGENGLFRIRRGVNECGIEGQVVAGEA